MPLPMVHLSIAVRVQEILGWALTGDYLLGNLSPDAIHMRAGSGRCEKDAVHFYVGTLSEEKAFEAIRGLIRKEYAGSHILPSFRTGYALHLLADHYWTTGIVGSFIDGLPKTMPDSEKRTLYYHETDQVDFNLYHRMAWRPKVWDILTESTPRDFDGLLSAAEIQKWLVRDLNWFENRENEPGNLPIYITDEITGSFIEGSAEIAAQFFNDFAN